jgi:hypothetical protein
LTEQLYEKVETDAALGALEALSGMLPESFLLMGGWAVYVTVNRSYQQEHGSTYLGSRDIDVGFHIEPKWDEEELRRSSFHRAIEILGEEGYERSGSFRFGKYLDRDDGRTLTRDEQKLLPSYQVLNLYVDMMVDNIHPLHKMVFKVDPIDERIIGMVSADGSAEAHRAGQVNVMIPPPHHLLASKLGSIPQRQNDDKVIKDACDIYAIIWYSRLGFREIVAKAKELYPDRFRQARAVITPEIAGRAATHLGVDEKTYRNVIDLLQ